MERRLRAARVFFGHGTDNARDEAAALVFHAMKLSHAGPASLLRRRASAAQAEKIADLLERRVRERVPLAYLTHEAWLQGVPFYVDERAIVPRSFIAELIADGSIDPWLSERTTRVLDLCTGNGSLAVLAAMAWPEIRVDASDLSTDALAVARINVERHGLGDRIALIESDVLAATPGPYDLILCNPPYVNAQSMAVLPREYRAEPEMALGSGADGMDFTRRLIAAAPAAMSGEAVLVLEIGNEREHFERAFPRLEAVWLETSAGADQVLLLTREAIVAAA